MNLVVPAASLMSFSDRRGLKHDFQTINKNVELNNQSKKKMDLIWPIFFVRISFSKTADPIWPTFG